MDADYDSQLREGKNGLMNEVSPWDPGNYKTPKLLPLAFSGHRTTASSPSLLHWAEFVLPISAPFSFFAAEILTWLFNIQTPQATPSGPPSFPSGSCPH